MRKSEKLFCHYLFKEYNTILLGLPKKNAEEDTDGNAGETMIEPLFIMRWNVGIHGTRKNKICWKVLDDSSGFYILYFWVVIE